MLPREAHEGAWLLKDIGSGQPLLGCYVCADKPTCGGLHLPNGTALLTCLDHCRCDDSSKCDFVCPKRPGAFARRFKEVRGFEFENIPRKPSPALPRLPKLVTILEGQVAQRRPVELDYAAIPLTRALTGRGRMTRAKTAEELRRDHGVFPKKGWVLTGIEDDRYVERSWGLSTLRSTFKAMTEAGAIFATSPNYSLYLDSPRQDNLHAMKRIAWMWYSMNEAGLPTALHINGRTDHDFERWADFIAARPEVTSIAFEFLTGAKLGADAERYIARLAELRANVSRPLLIAVRGAAEYAHRLEKYFDQVMWLDATPYFKAVHRQEPTFGADDVLRYRPREGGRDAPVGSLFKRLVSAAERRFHSSSASLAPSPQRVLDLRPSALPTQVRADDASGQMNLFAGDPGS